MFRHGYYHAIFNAQESETPVEFVEAGQGISLTLPIENAPSPPNLDSQYLVRVRGEESTIFKRRLATLSSLLDHTLQNHLLKNVVRELLRLGLCLHIWHPHAGRVSLPSLIICS